MSYFVTPILGLQLATPGSGQAFETTVVNADFVAIDTAIGASRTRLNAIEATPILQVADLAALNATAAVVGGLRTVNEGGATFIASGTGWVQQTPAFFGSAAAILTAYAKAGGAYKTNNAFAGISTTGVMYQWSADRGIFRIVNPGRIAVGPGSSGAAGPGVTIVGTKVNFVNNVGDLNIYGCFTDEFDLYDVTIAFVSNGTGLTFRVIDDASIIDVAANYAAVSINGNGAAVGSFASGFTSSALISSGGAINGNIRLRVAFARSVQAGLIEFEGSVFSGASVGTTLKGGARHNVPAKFGGLALQFSAASTGYVIIEGVKG